MPDTLARETIREIKPLNASEPVGSATLKVIEAGLPGLPACLLYTSPSPRD